MAGGANSDTEGAEGTRRPWGVAFDLERPRYSSSMNDFT